MSDHPPAASVNDLQFGQIFRFGSLLKAIGSAISPSRIGIAMFMLALLVGGGRTWDAIVSEANTGQASSIRDPFDSTMQWLGRSGGQLTTATVTLNPEGFVAASSDLMWGTTARLWKDGHSWFVVLFGLWTAAVLALGGGMLCRLEAVQIATDDPAPINPAMAMSLWRWPSFFGALVVPFVLVAIMALGLMVFGFVLFNLPILNLIGGIGYGIALLVGLGVTLLVLGFAVGCPIAAPCRCDRELRWSRRHAPRRRLHHGQTAHVDAVSVHHAARTGARAPSGRWRGIPHNRRHRVVGQRVGVHPHLRSRGGGHGLVAAHRCALVRGVGRRDWWPSGPASCSGSSPAGRLPTSWLSRPGPTCCCD